jgi:hypothetical protein
MSEMAHLIVLHIYSDFIQIRLGEVSSSKGF